MKKLFVIFILSFLQTVVFAQTPTQNLEVLMIGASHQYNPQPKQNLTGIHTKIRVFKPDAVFGEWLSPEDEKAIKDYWNKKNVLSRIDRLKQKNNIDDKDLTGLLIKYENVLEKNPDNMKNRIDLAVAYYLNHDAGNGYFQMWNVAKHLQKNPKDTAVFNYARLKYFSAAVDSLHEAINPYIDDEYDYVAHPMMVEFGLKKIYPMDSQRWDNEWSEAWGKADSVFYARLKLLKKDSLSNEGKKAIEIDKYIRNRMDYLRNDAIKTFSMNHITEGLNGPQMTEWLFRINLYSDEYRQLSIFPADLYAWKFHWWWHRNNDMCNNTIERAKVNGFKKVMIVVGANHAAIMTKIFREKGVKVTNIIDAPLK
ncbi:DUF5694 domain-containing protein [Emticicia sp. TH156]|uniref:DUF5694 domain-containing protein n=1 Tax=Emticicia sp. TH156 TaxID=2067454 RepID=UPI000C76C798|nr:DUF5694 domain-containing protein [Emticicia sp. TH156]PLK42320.1 hypothetical protein C0V77_21610 [Emticicia sp. TH156]